jgi:hypothetical protein
VSGLTRAAVSNHRGIQGENVRIGVIQRDGKWHFNVWPASDEKGKRERLLQKEKEAIDTDASYIVGDGSSAAQSIRPLQHSP